MRKIISMLLVFFLMTVAHAADFVLTSPAFKNNQRIPVLYTCDGKNISPKLEWANPPPKTASFALTLYSPDSVVGVYHNWVIYNIPATYTSLAEGISKDLPDNIANAMNSAGDSIYRGPCPPDTGLHHYSFELYALDAEVDLSEASDLDEIIRILNKHKISSAVLTGLFSH